MFDGVGGYSMLILKLLPARHAERPRAGLFISGCLRASRARRKEDNRLRRRAEPLPLRPRLTSPGYIPMTNCPRCGLLNPETAQRCDCGYNFELRTVERT